MFIIEAIVCTVTLKINDKNCVKTCYAKYNYILLI